VPPAGGAAPPRGGPAHRRVRPSRIVPAAVDLVRRRRSWVSKGLWAIMDQGLFALSAFVLSVLLARWLTPGDYGAFAVASTILLLMGTVHTALLGEPMHVFGPSRYRGRTADYVRRMVPLHFAATLAMSAVLLAVVAALTLFHRVPSTDATLAALALAAPCILFLWLMRRACYIDSRPHLAAVAGLGYVLLLPAALLLVEKVAVLTAASALLLSGVASLVVAWGLKSRLTGRRQAAADRIPFSDIGTVHWKYGKWALGSGFLSWVPANAVVLALPLWYSLSDAGTLRVATTLMLPMLNVQTALAALILPVLVRARLSGQLRHNATMAGLLFLGLSIVYAPVVVVFGSSLTRLLFGAQYEIRGMALWLLAVIPLVTSVSAVAGAVLRAVERPDRVLWTYIAATAMTCVVGLPLVYRFGVDGALAALLFSATTTAISGVWAAQRLASPDSAGASDSRIRRRSMAVTASSTSGGATVASTR
jgi:O-antigen/teichoic acid export membrane protein